MYENGRQLNRYACKQIHQSKAKRKATPLNFSSYDIYVDNENKKEWMQYPIYQKLISNGWKPLHQQWWKGYPRYLRKGFLKEDAHQKERAYYRQQISHYDLEEDNIHIKEMFSDPWCWD